ncbi:long-chain fatty acid transporter [Naematelia encephala]|uniref:Long-chain fatty acid transporter n=1 Tax=Naematelia encephala TaxID=71784 RepID=A0A1Y2BHP7_9TREE|nr:long-chain fatty acid transporter [Naematelia encephala]
MVNVQAQFDKAVAIVKALPPDGPVKPSQDEQLAFYAHFKQANEGDCTGTRPGAFDFKGKYKYDAWKKLEGTSKEDAKVKYVELLKSMLEKVNDDSSKKYLAELEAVGQ